MMVEWRGAIRCINFGGTDENATDQMRGAALVVEKRNTENEDRIDGDGVAVPLVDIYLTQAGLCFLFYDFR